MQDFLEKKLHLKPAITDYPDTELFPLFLRGLYRYQLMRILDNDCLLAMPVEDVNLSALRKHRQQMTRYTNMEIVFCFDALTPYKKEKLVEDGIPFILDDKEAYLPFVGTYLTDSKGKPSGHKTKPDKFTPTAQKLLLLALEKEWKHKTVSEAAAEMSVSPMTVSRAFDEFEAADLPLTVKEGRTRSFVWEGSHGELWEKTQKFLRTPVKKKYELAQPLKEHDLPLAGMSALCRYTMLADNVYQTYAVTAQQARELKLDELPCVPPGEVPTAIVEIISYRIDDGKAIDPLSAILSISDEEKEDPRVEQAMRQLLEDTLYVDRN